jgi:hypothetical protein
MFSGKIIAAIDLKSIILEQTALLLPSAVKMRNPA